MIALSELAGPLGRQRAGFAHVDFGAKRSLWPTALLKPARTSDTNFMGPLLVPANGILHSALGHNGKRAPHS